MYGASAAFYREITRSHTVVSRLDATQGEDTAQLTVVGGRGVTIDYDLPTRRDLDIVIKDDTRTATELEDLLDVFLTVLTPYRGVRYDDGTEELIPCGQFFTEKLTLAEADDGGVVARITAFDASTRCQGDLDRPFVVDSGAAIDQVVPQLLGRKMPALRYRLASVPWDLPMQILRGQVNPWQKARDFYEAVGYGLTIDRDGICVTEPPATSVADDPVWEFIEGENATFAAGGERTLGAEDFPNVVVVKGTNAATGTAVRGEAADEDPSSPTFRGGPTGERILEVESEKVTSEDQAAAMARVILARELGPQEEYTFNVLANPGLDVPDVISVTRERLGLIDRRMIVTRINALPFTVGGSGTMQITARRSIITDGAGVIGRQ